MKLLLWIFVVCYYIVFDACVAKEHTNRRDRSEDKKRHGYFLHYTKEYSQFQSRNHAKITNVNIARKTFRKEYSIETNTDFMGGATSDLQSEIGKVAREHRNHRYRPEHKDKKKHHHFLHYAKVKMPSEMMVSITTPYKDSRFKCGDHAKLMNVNFLSNMFRNEYKAIMWDFVAGASSVVKFKTVKIEKVLNPCLWSKYLWRKQQIVAEAKEANEMMLFHSSNYNWRNMDKGFDERYAKIGPYGAGLYFTADSAKAHDNSKLQSDGTRTILLCRVALGKSSEIGPTRLAHAPVGYHSVKGEYTEDYVIYRGEQVLRSLQRRTAYPEYLITYKT